MADHPAVEHHHAAAESFHKAAEHHSNAAEAHADGDHALGLEHAEKGKQEGLEAALKSEAAANASKTAK